jgi:phosphoglycerate dehydrogenase-like enzyme
MPKAKIAVLDDYQGVALQFADWSQVKAKADVTVFDDHIVDEDALVERLLPFQVICVMRERTPMRRSLLSRLPNLKLICSTGAANASIDLDCTAERGIEVKNTGYTSNAAIELTWALILASARHLTVENASLKAGGWQRTVGEDLAGATLGLIGLGKIGTAVAKVGLAFGMNVIAWSQHLTAEKAAAADVKYVAKEELLATADFISVHVVLSDRTRDLLGAAELALVKPGAHLINTSRGPIVNEKALLDALAAGKIAGAALDVFDVEPLPPDHPLRTAPNLVATPHIGYVTKGTYKRFYEDTVSNLLEWLD